MEKQYIDGHGAPNKFKKKTGLQHKGKGKV